MYHDIKDSLKDLPMTWYPDLLKTIVEESIRKKVFQSPETLVNFVKKITEKEPNG